MKILKLVFLVAITWFACFSVAHATAINITPLAGSQAADYNWTWIPPDSYTISPNSYNDDTLWVWNEKQNVTLTEDLFVDRVADASADFVEIVSGGYLISAGTVVSSHYVQWDPAGGKDVNATIEFDSEIFAFITADQKLFDSDSSLGLDWVNYNDFKLRGLEKKDMTFINGTSVDIDWRASSPGDWTRLITAYSPAAATPEPGTIALLSLGLIGLAGVSRKKLKKRQL